MRWIEALKIWNRQHNPGGWCVAKKGTPEYNQIKAIMDEAKPKKAQTGAQAFGGTEKEDVMRDMVRIPALQARIRNRKRETVKEFLRTAIERRRAKKAAERPPVRPEKVTEDRRKELLDNVTADLNMTLAREKREIAQLEPQVRAAEGAERERLKGLLEAHKKAAKKTEAILKKGVSLERKGRKIKPT